MILQNEKAGWFPKKGTFPQNPASTFLIFSKIEPQVPSYDLLKFSAI